MGEIFTGKNLVRLEEVLANRDYRKSLIEKIMKEKPQKSVLSYKLNIPGPEKNNQALGRVFDRGLRDIIRVIEEESWSYELVEIWDKNTGKEGILAVKTDGMSLKKSMVNLEEESDITRL